MTDSWEVNNVPNNVVEKSPSDTLDHQPLPQQSTILVISGLKGISQMVSLVMVRTLVNLSALQRRRSYHDHILDMHYEPSKGIAVIKVNTLEVAAKVQEEMDGMRIYGKEITVEILPERFTLLEQEVYAVAIDQFLAGRNQPSQVEPSAQHQSQPVKKFLDKNKELETSTTMADLPPSAGRHRKLPAELNQQIFYCLNLPTRRKFICGLGWGFYAMFRQILLKKSKRLRNLEGNAWRYNGQVTISNGGLIASNNTNQWPDIYTEKEFSVSVADCRMDGFPGTICYYYEVKILNPTERWCTVGLTDGAIFRGLFSPISYAIHIPIPIWNYYHFYIAGQHHLFYFPLGLGIIRPEVKDTGNVIGCGILINPDDKLAIFFTLNGILIDRQIQINPTVDHLVPTVALRDGVSVEANFGENPAKPFEYDIEKCPGMGLEWI